MVCGGGELELGKVAGVELSWRNRARKFDVN
jgi:hypothetical protein